MSKLHCGNYLVSFGFRGASLERQLPKLRRKGYSCQCITHFGCCIKRKQRENIQVCVNVLPTSYRHITNCQPTGSLYFGQNLSADCWLSVGRQTADSQPTVGRQTTNSRSTVSRQTADSRPTGFFGSCSSQLPLVKSDVIQASEIYFI